jgi:hypothetical protein
VAFLAIAFSIQTPQSLDHSAGRHSSNELAIDEKTGLQDQQDLQTRVSNLLIL